MKRELKDITLEPKLISSFPSYNVQQIYHPLHKGKKLLKVLFKQGF